MLILIGGVSRSGKSVLAERLAAELRQNALVLHQDEYAKPNAELPKIDGLPDWEVPDSLDWERWLADIETGKTDHDLVIAEGIFAFLPESLQKNADLRIYMTIPYDLFMQRRKADKRWGDFPEWYYEHVWQSHFEFGLAQSSGKLLSLNGTASVETNLERVMEFLQKHTLK